MAALVIAVSSWVAYERVREALEGEFERRLGRIATTAASQIGPDLVLEILRGGDEATGYGLVLSQLSTLWSTTGVHDAALLDSTGVVLVDARAADGIEGLPSTLDSLAGPALQRASAGVASISAVYRVGERPLRAGFAPVEDSHGPTLGLVAIEAEATYLAVLAGLARTLALIAAISVLAVTVLAVLIIRAVSSAAQLERRLARAENLAAMGRLTATLAHEIKNPLAIIRGSAERLTRHDPETRRMADFVVDEVDRLSKTVTRYLRFARGGPELHEIGDATAALEATLALLEGELKARRVQLVRLGGPPAPVAVRLDNDSLKQVYLNLILNALEAMPEGGTLTVGGAERHGRVEVTIADQGLGMPHEVFGRAGNPFFTTKAKGSGLGLFLTRRLVQASGGDLRIRSQAGRGTTCTVVLPRAKG